MKNLEIVFRPKQEDVKTLETFLIINDFFHTIGVHEDKRIFAIDLFTSGGISYSCFCTFTVKDLNFRQRKKTKFGILIRGLPHYSYFDFLFVKTFQNFLGAYLDYQQRLADIK